MSDLATTARMLVMNDCLNVVLAHMPDGIEVAAIKPDPLLGRSELLLRDPSGRAFRPLIEADHGVPPIVTALYACLERDGELGSPPASFVRWEGEGARFQPTPRRL